MFGDEFGDEHGDKFGDHQIWRWIVWHIRHLIWWFTKLGDDICDIFVTKFGWSPICVNFVARMIISYVLTHVMMTKNIQGWIFGMET